MYIKQIDIEILGNAIYLQETNNIYLREKK